MTDISRRAVFVGLSVFGVVAQLGETLAADAPATGGKRVALQGFDPVAYFTDGHPEKGSAEYSASFDDATYRFKSAEHRAQFAADPERYAPQYSGFCAVQVSRGVKAEADPEAWLIHDGKLYVFMAKRGATVFQEQTASVLEKATQNWPELRKSP